MISLEDKAISMNHALEADQPELAAEIYQSAIEEGPHGPEMNAQVMASIAQGLAQ